MAIRFQRFGRKKQPFYRQVRKPKALLCLSEHWSMLYTVKLSCITVEATMSCCMQVGSY